MSVISCNINLGTYIQTIYVINKNTNTATPYQVSMNTLEQVLCNMAKEYGEVRLYGNENYIMKFAKAIQNDVPSEYGNYPIDIYINDELV